MPDFDAAIFGAGNDDGELGVEAGEGDIGGVTFERGNE